MIRRGFALFVGAIFAAFAAAQSQASSPPNSQNPAEPGASAQLEASGGALANGTALNAELNSAVDSKKAKAGDKVEAHTTEAVKNGAQTIVPKGAKLEGHVTEATARSKGDSGSTLAIQFDKAIPKKGEEIPLNVAILAIAAPQSDFSGGSPGPGSDPMANSGGAAAGGSPMGPSRPQNPNPASVIPDSANTPAGSVAGSTSSASGGPNGRGPLPANSRGVFGLSGVQLMVDTSKANQGTMITSTGKNVHLDSGTRLLLLLVARAEAPATPGR
jgi:hypothetical protein